MRENRPTFTLYANSGGCPQNQLDGGQIFNYLEASGYEFSDNARDADLIIVNSCAYRHEKEDQAINEYYELRRNAKPGTKIIFTGCLPRIAPGRLNEIGADTAIIPGIDLESIMQVVPPVTSTWRECAPNQIPRPILRYVKPFREFLSSTLAAGRGVLPYSAARHLDRLLMYDHSARTFVIRVAGGCLGQCTYCAIRFSRGKLVSRPVDEVLAEVRKAVSLHVPEILLCATDLAAYGRDIGVDLGFLLREVLSSAPTQYLLLFYANPRWLIDRWDGLEDVFASGRIHFIHLSMNGGSDRVLKRMRRGFTSAEFERLVKAIKRVSPGTVLQTQIITGFPGETDQDVDETLDFLRRNYMHNVQVHAFDPRPGTEAASMPDQVVPEIRRQRRRRVYRLTLAAKLGYDVRYVIRGFRIPAS